MTVHAPVVRAPVHAPHVPVQALYLAALVMAVALVTLLVLSALQPSTQAGFSADEIQRAYQDYRRDERAPLPPTQDDLQQLWNQFRSEERALY